jgi:hypothetical protein
MAYYSGTTDDIGRILKTLKIGEGTLDELLKSDVEAIQKDIDTKIDASLSNLYYTPLQQITRSGVTKFPDPIVYIAKRLVAADLILNSQVNVDTNVATTAQTIAAKVEKELFELGSKTVGSKKLDGQRVKTRIRFAPPNIFPSAEPLAPV